MSRDQRAWRPGSASGERPFNHVAGGGTFVKFTILPLSLAWEVFEEKNGAGSRAAFEQMIRRLISGPKMSDPEIGCTILTAPYFWPKEYWISDPIGWTRNVVRGRYYDTGNAEGASLWASVQERFGDPRASQVDNDRGSASQRDVHPYALPLREMRPYPERRLLIAVALVVLAVGLIGRGRQE